MTTFLRLKHGWVHAERYAHLGPHAMLMHLYGLSYSSQHLTDGRVPKRLRLTIAPHLAADGIDPEQVAGELVTAGVWCDEGDHWLIPSFLEHNRSRAEVEEVRALDRERKRKERTSRDQIPDNRESIVTPDGVPADSGRSPSGQDLVAELEAQAIAEAQARYGPPSLHVVGDD